MYFLANFLKTKIERSNLIGKSIKLYLGKIKNIENKQIFKI